MTPTKTKPKTNTTTPSIEELEAELAKALADHEAAKAKVHAAEAAFDGDPSDATLDALHAAQKAATIAETFVGRAGRVLDAGKKAAADAERARLEELRARLEAELAYDAVERESEPLVRAEAEALAKAAVARAERIALADVVRDKALELERTRRLLGEDVSVGADGLRSPSRRVPDHRGLILSHDRVGAVLDETSRTLEQNDPLISLLRAARPTPASYAVSYATPTGPKAA